VGFALIPATAYQGSPLRGDPWLLSANPAG